MSNLGFYQQALQAARDSLEDQVNTFNEKKEQNSSEQDAISMFDLPLSTEILKESATSEPMKALYTKLLSRVTGMSEDTAKELIEKVASGDTKELLNTNLRKLIGDKIQATGNNIKEFKNNLKLEYNKRAQEIKDFKKQKLDETKQKFDEIKKQYDETDDEGLKLKLNQQLEDINQERKDIVQKVSEELKGLKQEAQERLDNAIDEYSGYLDRLKNVPSNMVEKFNKFFGNIKDLKEGEIPKINLDNLKISLENKLKSTIEGIKAKRDDLIQQSREEYNKLRSQFNGEEDEDIRAQLKEQMNSIKDKIKGYKESAENDIESAQDDITGQISKLTDAAKSKVENLVGDAKDTVNELIENSRFKGVKDMLGKVVDWVKNNKTTPTQKPFDMDELVNNIKTKGTQLLKDKAQELTKPFEDRIENAKELFNNAKSKFNNEFNDLEFKPPQALQDTLDSLNNKLSSVKSQYETEINKANPDEDVVRTLQEQMRKLNNSVADKEGDIEDIVNNLKQTAKQRIMDKLGLKDDGNGLELNLPDVEQTATSAVSKAGELVEQGLNAGRSRITSAILGQYQEGAIPTRGTRVLGDLMNSFKNPEATLNSLKENLGNQTRTFIKQIPSTDEIQQNISSQIESLKPSVKINASDIFSKEQQDMISNAKNATQDILNTAQNSTKDIVNGVAKDTANKVGDGVLKDVGEDVAEDTGEVAAESIGSELLNFLLPGLGVAIGAGIMGGQIAKLVKDAHKQGNFNPTSAAYQIGS